MSKTLFLVRHAESEQPDSRVKDAKRQLTATGRRDATRLGNYLADQGVLPDLIMTSSAVRAVSTAELIAERIKYKIERIRSSDEIYDASIRILLKFINEQANDIKNVMLVAHNPAISFLADYLTAEDMGGLAPCTMVSLSFDFNDWTLISQHTGSIKEIRSPD